MPWEVSDEVMICASHQILEEDGEREPNHGHNWRIRAFFRADALNDRGLAMDFRVLKANLWEAVAPYDHRHLNDLEAFSSVEPTAEELARIVFSRLQGSLPKSHVRLDRVEVWMTDTGCAVYRQ